MGMIWRSAMPLLTTLAALVIIVHCVEEDLETEYRHDLRPRILDTGTHSNDQPWRAMEETPEIQERHTANWDENSPDEAPKRRRPGRKRKRRPQTPPNEDLTPQERFPYPDEPPRPYFDVDYENNRQTTEMPKRRRKKPEQRPVRWTDDDMMVVERPLRKRPGARRKRPSLDKWPTLSEFSDFLGNHEVFVEDKTDSPVPVTTVSIHDVSLHEVIQTNLDNVRVKTGGILPNTKPEDPHSFNSRMKGGTHNEQISKTQLADDKSLSEFSVELVSDLRATKLNTYEDHNSKNHREYKDKVSTVNNKQNKSQGKNWSALIYWDLPGVGNITVEQRNTSDVITFSPKYAGTEKLKSAEKMEIIVENRNITLQQYVEFISALVIFKSKDKISVSRNDVYNDIAQTNEEPPDYWQDEINRDPVDPLTLKDILRRSNGTSLSEILQQHNLSLADLLHGKENAVSIFKSQDSLETQNKNPSDIGNDLIDKEIKTKPDIREESEEQVLVNSETKYATEPVTEHYTTTELVQENTNEALDVATTTAKPPEENMPKISTRRRYPPGLRKKLRMRPVLNVTNTYKGQLSRDLIALNARKYSHHRRITNKSKEWKDILPSMRQHNAHNDNNDTTVHETTTVTTTPEETTIISFEIENNYSSSENIRPQFEIDKLDDIDMDATESVAPTETTTEIPKNITEKPVAVVTMARPTAISSGLRRQAFNNRLKRKRLKHKNSTSEPPQDDLIKHLFGMGNLVSSSEFIAKTQEPRTTKDDTTEFTTVDDFVTTESTSKTDGPMHVKIITTIFTTPKSTTHSTTEETAKIEIDEILNDTLTSAKLSRILKERNMTLSELVEHRERGSSHVHLADIFHNASREPNPPEPFLSKSLLEPISKETYPLRAILEANLHDSNGKVTTIDPTVINNINIPVIMDYRNNVNENAENMGIMSLFNNFTKNTAKSPLLPDVEVNNHKVSEIVLNGIINANDTVRESRVLGETQDDVVSWNEIFSLMGTTQHNDTDEPSSDQPFKKITIEEDADGDGLIVLEDLQHLKDFDSNIALDSNEKLETDTLQKKDQQKGILDKIPIQTKSVTVATASIVGLAMILFLLTYAAFKWKQQRSMIRKKRSFCDERIPTPIFENRKGHKNNSSSRSISPMLQTSNIYTLNTLDTQNGKESPDYMWDSLRKPFQ